MRLDVRRAVTPNGIVEPASILVSGDRIVAVGEPAVVGETRDADVLALADVTVVPGFVDLQINGFAGVNFSAMHGADWTTAGAALLRRGTTTIVPTLVSAPRNSYAAALRCLADAAESGRGPRVAGVHMEGPFLAPSHAGAHDRAFLCAPDSDWVGALLDAAPLPVAIWTLAPELDGAEACIRALVRAGVVASIGHSNATAGECHRAADAGTSMVTHLFNAQRGLHHREPGVVGAALADPRWNVGIIVDGVHVAEAVLELVVPRLGGRVFAVSDAVAAAATPGDATTRVGGTPTDAREAAYIAGTTVLAGAVTDLGAAFARAVRLFGLDAAVSLTASVAARSIGATDIGRLATGARADLVGVSGADNAVAWVMARGSLVTR